MNRLRARIRLGTQWIPRQVRRVIIVVIGGSVLLLGVVMLVGPGPAIIVLPLGLAILAIEFAWARRWLKKIKNAAKHVRNRAMAARSSRAANGCTKSQQRAAGQA